tara:strand:- start:1545 stop:2099 length:555 start_codon:yes stop_codon:yes gene_type:complete
MKNFDDDSENGGEDRVSLEDLLRLKRYERPPDEFWEDFEVVLKKRTLQSVVREKPWFAIGGFRSQIFTAWFLRVSVGSAVLAIAIYFTPLAQVVFPTDQEVESSQSSPETDNASAVVTAGIEGSETREYKDGALTLSNSISSEFDTAFPSNDLRAVTSDSITYAEENLSTLFAESEPSDSRTIF